MAVLLPEGTLRRRLFEAADRALCRLVFGTDKTVSEECGNRIADGRCVGCKLLCRVLDLVEKDHCLKNRTAARPAA